MSRGSKRTISSEQEQEKIANHHGRHGERQRHQDINQKSPAYPSLDQQPAKDQGYGKVQGGRNPRHLKAEPQQRQVQLRLLPSLIRL